MLACLSVTLCMKGATVRSSRRVWLTGAGALAATMIAAACLAAPACGRRAAAARDVDRRARGGCLRHLGRACVWRHRRSAAALRAGPPRPRRPRSPPTPPRRQRCRARPPSAAALPALPGPMVALGDSYTAGALLPADLPARPLGCLRSTKAYPVLVAAALGASLTDAACSSAGVADMTAAQRTDLGTNPPQLNALAPDDSLVLLTLGGDDIGFMNVLDECMELSFTDPWGSPCRAHYTQRRHRPARRPGQGRGAEDGRRPVGHRRARPAGADRDGRLPGPVPAQRRLLAGGADHRRRHRLPARHRAPAERHARGRRQGGRGDLRQYLHARRSATTSASRRRIRDVEGLLPGSWALPFHPNARGQAAIAAAVLAALRARLAASPLAVRQHAQGSGWSAADLPALLAVAVALAAGGVGGVARRRWSWGRLRIWRRPWGKPARRSGLGAVIVCRMGPRFPAAGVSVVRLGGTPRPQVPTMTPVPVSVVSRVVTVGTVGTICRCPAGGPRVAPSAPAAPPPLASRHVPGEDVPAA